MILIAPGLNFRRRNRQIIKRPVSIGLIFSGEKSTSSFLKMARVKMDNPAQEIRDTTAGRRQESRVWIPEKERNL